VVKAKLNQVSQHTKGVVGILAPTNNLAAHSCDFVEELWPPNLRFLVLIGAPHL